MKQPNKGHIAFIAICDDAFTETASQLKTDVGSDPNNCSTLAWALAEQGWSVDFFAHQSEPPLQDDHPRYRKIFLPISLRGQLDNVLENLDAAAQAFLRYQESQGVIYPIIQTHCWASAWVGARLKQSQFVRLLHTAGPFTQSPAPASDTHPAAIERQCLEAVDCLIAPGGGNRDRPSDFGVSPNKIRTLSPTQSLTHQFDAIYREQLALLYRQFFFASPLPDPLPETITKAS
ncbi:MAG: glycosyltransferase [Cyanobacteria bacterium P01_A01_bin.135]